jgi:monothiol glutaredoxin
MTDTTDAPGAAGPGRPPGIRQISAPELKAMMEAGAAFELVDVRTEEERAIARLDGSRLLDRACHDYLLGLNRAITIVFHCHHGIRSQAAAEYFLRQGFQDLYNLQGGIDAWSQLVDPSVPRYR